MKLGTVLKLGALGIAATAAAAGSVLITTKALNKVSGGTTANPSTTPVENKPETSPAEEKTPVPEFIPAVTPVTPEVLPTVEEAPQPVVTVEEDKAPVEEASPVVEEAAPEEKVEETVVDYSDMPMDLPYLAGKLDEEEKDAEEVVVPPVAAESSVEPVAPVEPVVPVAPVVPVTPVAAAEPEVILSSSAPIMDESPATETLLGQEPEKAETFADLNPHEQGYAVGMSDIDGEELPPAESTSNFSDFSEPEPAPVTFDDLTHNETVTVEEPTPAIVEPAVEPEVVAEPEAAAESEAAVESAPASEAPVTESVAEETVDAKGSTVKIGDAVVSDKGDDAAIKAVVDEFHVPASNLVSITADGNMPMVFEFIYSDMRTDATLMSVYFIMPDGKATLPPETDRENVLAFGRNFITENEDLRKFLA